MSQAGAPFSGAGVNKATKRALRENSKGTDGRSRAAQVSHQTAGGTVESATEQNESLKNKRRRFRAADVCCPTDVAKSDHIHETLLRIPNPESRIPNPESRIPNP
ncbi:hypothetical protein [Xanthomonas vesicatoria]|nr:hypothetical protein [Xanthomonas vesicatoria]